MTNREKLQSMAIYDLLVWMNEELGADRQDPVCIMDALGASKPCGEGNCKQCIGAWLNEEVQNG